MINNLNYEQIIQISNTLKQLKEIIESTTSNIKNDEIEDFMSTLEGYTKYLETLVKLNKDADEAIKNMV